MEPVYSIDACQSNGEFRTYVSYDINALTISVYMCPCQIFLRSRCGSRGFYTR